MSRFNLIFLCYFYLFGLISLNAQEKGVDLNQKAKLFQMMKDRNVNVGAVKAFAKQYFEGRDKGRGSGYKQYKRWEYQARKFFPSGKRNIVPASQAWNEITKFKKAQASLKNSLKATSNWTELGPKTSENVNTHWAPGVGRINDIAVDPNNSNVIYVGTPAGGLWKTTNEGGTWTPLTDDLPAIGVSGIAIDPNNSNVVYIGTGDRDGSDTYGVGVLKSTDAGASFSTTGLNWDFYDFRTVGVIRVNPENSNIVFAGTSSGLYRSANAGANWTKVLDGDCEDVELKPGDANTVYAISKSGSSYFYRSTDGGQNFTQVSSGLSASSRAFISVTAANSNYVYLLSANSSGQFGGIYRSTNSGSSFSLRGNSPDIFGYEANDGYSQYWYDLCLAASPVNSEEIHIGAITTWKSTNGGSSFTQTSKWYYTDWLNNKNAYRYIHCDMHALEFSANGTLYSGSDGMICKTTDGFATHANTINLTEGLGIRQFYGIGLSATDENKFIGGSQDNGTSVTINGEWTEWLGADGGDAKIDWSNSNIIYGTTQNGGAWYQSTDGGYTFSQKNSPGSGNWVVPWVMDYNNPNILYVGTSEVRKTTNQMGSWSTISSFGDGNYIDAIAVAPSNSNYLYVTKTVSSVQRTYVTKNGGSSWTEITNTLPNLAVTYITVHPSDPEKIAVSLSGYTAGEKVYTSSNAGSAWVNRSDNLPNLPANCLVYHDGTEDGLYVGMDVGVYYRNNNSSNWEDFFTGMPNVIVSELEIQYSTGKIFAGTFGRGLWASSLATSSGLNADFTADKVKVAPGETISYTDNSNTTGGVTITNWVWTFEGGNPANYSGQNPPSITYNSEGLYDVSLTITGSNGETATKTETDFINVTSSTCINASLNLTLDAYPEETTWAIKDAQGNTLHSGGSYVNPDDIGVTKTYSFCLDEGCYDFVIEDTYGDGLGVSPVGSYNLSDEFGNELASGQGGDFTSIAATNYCVGDIQIIVPPTLSVGNITQNSIGLSWDYSSDAPVVSEYKVYQDGSLIHTTTEKLYLVTNLTSSTSYQFAVSAIDALGNESVQSNVVTAITLDPADDGGPLTRGVTANGNIDNSSDTDMWYIDVAANAISMEVILTCGSEDFDTYGRFNAEPTTSIYDWRGYTSGGEENTVNSPQEGRHYIMVNPYSGTGAYTLTARIEYDVVDTIAPDDPTNLIASNISSNSVDLNWTEPFDKVGVTAYDIYNNGATILTTVITNSAQLTDLLPNTTYNLSLKAKDAAGNESGFSNTVTFKTDNAPFDYCTASATNGPEYISRVQFASIDNSSSRADYTYYSNGVNVNTGGTYTLTVDIGNIYNGDKVSCWVDWNVNGEFETDEYTSLTLNGSTATAELTVPLTASGEARMRIRLFYNLVGDVACGTASYGEVEDYKLIVAPSAQRESFINNEIIGARIYPNPVKEKLNIDLLGLEDGDLQLINMNGQVVLSKQLTSEKTELDVSGISKGIYMLKIISSNKILQKKVILK